MAGKVWLVPSDSFQPDLAKDKGGQKRIYNVGRILSSKNYLERMTVALTVADSYGGKKVLRATPEAAEQLSEEVMNARLEMAKAWGEYKKDETPLASAVKVLLWRGEYSPIKVDPQDRERVICASDPFRLYRESRDEQLAFNEQVVVQLAKAQGALTAPISLMGIDKRLTDIAYPIVEGWMKDRSERASKALVRVTEAAAEDLVKILREELEGERYRRAEQFEQMRIEAGGWGPYEGRSW